jgi:hypothetical protein
MDIDIVRYINSQNSEHRQKLIDYFKCYTSNDMDEFAERRKQLGGKKFLDKKLSFQNFIMTILPIEDILKKVESDFQSHST